MNDRQAKPVHEQARASFERFKPAPPIGDPVTFLQAFAAVCTKFTAYLLLRDFWNMNLTQCQQVEFDAGNSEAI
jgi:hypothetical protein